MPRARRGRAEVILGIDVGGTSIGAGLVAPSGEVVDEAQAPTRRAGAPAAWPVLVELTERMVARAARAGRRILGIGAGVPGIIHPETGEVGEEAHHVPDLIGIPVAPRLAERFSLPAFADNDVNALALGEWTFGAGRGARSLVVLAPGTGLGCGVIVEGRVVRGSLGFGGEFGHAPVRFDGAPCWCGGRGCLAVYASGRGIAETARARVVAGSGGRLLEAAHGDLDAIDAPLVFEQSAAGDPVAADIAHDACRALGAMIAVIINGLNPEAIVVTGGVAAAFLVLEKAVLAAAAAHAFPRALAGTRVAIAPGDKRVTMRGAAALVLYEMGARGGPAGAARPLP